MDRKKTRRLYREEGLMVRRRKSRRRIAVASPSSLGPMARRWQPPIPPPTGPNSRWSLDFVHDRLANGRRFRVLNVIDDVTKECLAAIPDTSISGKRVVREMRAIIERRGKPDAVVGDDHCPAGDLQGKSAGRGHRVHVNGRAGLHTGARARPALHRAREANPERHGRKLPRPDARRMPKWAPVLLDGSRPCGDRCLARRLQHRATARVARIHDPGCLRGLPETAMAINATLDRWLRADGHCPRRAYAQISPHDAGRKWMSDGGHIT